MDKKAPKNKEGDTTFIPYISSRNMKRKPRVEGGRAKIFILLLLLQQQLMLVQYYY
jgi:hypothetical protein